MAKGDAMGGGMQRRSPFGNMGMGGFSGGRPMNNNMGEQPMGQPMGMNRPRMGGGMGRGNRTSINIGMGQGMGGGMNVGQGRGMGGGMNIGPSKGVGFGGGLNKIGLQDRAALEKQQRQSGGYSAVMDDEGINWVNPNDIYRPGGLQQMDVLGRPEYSMGNFMRMRGKMGDESFNKYYGPMMEHLYGSQGRTPVQRTQI